MRQRHNSWVELMLVSESLVFPVNRFPSVVALCLVALRVFVIRALQPGGAQNIGFNAGGLYQDEFYRACALVLKRVYLRSGWSDPSMRTKGRVDFRRPRRQLGHRAAAQWQPR